MNSYYYKGLGRLTTGDIDWVNHEIYVSLIFKDEYVVDLDNDEFFNVIPEAAIASTTFLPGRYVDNRGVMDGEDIKFNAVPGDGSKEANVLIIWRKINNQPIVSPLIAYLDQVTNFPVYPDGNDISISWSNGDSKILRLKQVYE